MKKQIFILLLAIPAVVSAQIGVKGGINFANVTKVSSINNTSRSGFHVGAFISPLSRGLFGSRTELIYSRQGYDYKTNTNTGNVSLDYITLPQMMTINLTRLFQVQLGGQVSYLLNADVDSTGGTGGGTVNALMDYYNRLDFGLSGGIEIHPKKNLLLGARMNIGLTKLYKDAAPGSGSPSFVPKEAVKNNLFQVFIGYHFGRK